MLDVDRHFHHPAVMNLALQTERLTLTPFSASDVDIAIATFTDPDVRKYAGGPMPEQRIRREMANWTKRGGNGCIGVWRIADRRSGEKLGSTALLPMPIDAHETDYGLVVPGRMPAGDVEIGYFLKRSAWGKGFATEACQRVVRMAFEQSPLQEVVATFDGANSASRRVLEKAGFIDRGTRRSYGAEGPDFRITRDEWLNMSRGTPVRHELP